MRVPFCGAKFTLKPCTHEGFRGADGDQVFRPALSVGATSPSSPALGSTVATTCVPGSSCVVSLFPPASLATGKDGQHHKDQPDHDSAADAKPTQEAPHSYISRRDSARAVGRDGGASSDVVTELRRGR